MANQTLGERIRLARKNKDMTQEQLGAVEGLKVSREAVSLWEKDRNAPTSDKLGIIAAATGVRGEWLISGVGAMLQDGPASPLPSKPSIPEAMLSPREMARDIPVLGTASCGPEGKFAFESGVIDYVRRPPRLAGITGAYALYTAGTSMYPWRREHELVYVLPNLPVQVGDRVVVQLREHEHVTEAYIKELLGRTTKELRLLQYNPHTEIRIPLAKVVHVHKIIDWSELLGV